MSINKLQTYKNLKVIVTGSTGFKGTWLCYWLHLLNAKVVGIALKPEKDSILFKKLLLSRKIKQIYLDINNLKKLNQVIKKEKPDIIFHLAAQSVVSESYANPIGTITTNVLGSANILEVVRINEIKNLVYITSDKCYLNDGRKTSYFENDTLGGEDLYSASKACAELVFESYHKSFLLKNKKLSYATTRAGNVIGGGDMKKNRIVPDVIKSLKNKTPLIIRSPNSTRPWQHVLEPISGYLKLGEMLMNRKLSSSIEPNWNFGPNTINCRTVIHVVKEVISCWGEEKKINIVKNKELKEAKLLMIANRKAKKELDWSPTLNFKETIKMTVEWYKNCFFENNAEETTRKQIEYFLRK
ncbi:CDP-glucose 4,6-dehydratase [Candidatus Pelagibacter sp. Uisw_090]|uniref:CDP-glucose 4,6-dehydratase n=1 Tax=Candidatus Pelagibacter sp. Uisw_090 TaxID=3230993 RepID=UPI0039E733D3